MTALGDSARIRGATQRNRLGATAAHHNLARPAILLAKTSPQQCAGRNVSSNRQDAHARGRRMAQSRLAATHLARDRWFEESTNHRFLPHMTPSAACIAPGVRGACGSRSFAHVTQFTKGAAASPARISARSERRYAGDQLGWRNSGFSKEARSVHPAARANSSKNPRSWAGSGDTMIPRRIHGRSSSCPITSEIPN